MFSIKLKYKNQNISRLFKSSQHSFECEDEAVMEICECLSNNEGIDFQVTGFNINWPVDVCTDLSTIIPQIPSVILSIRNFNNTTIQFYEQGIEKELSFNCKKEQIEITCNNLDGSSISSNIEKIDYLEADKILMNLLKDFIKLGEVFCALHMNSTVMKLWIEKVSKL